MVTTTFANRAQATALSREIVAARLAACAQLMPIRSVYRWQGRVRHDREILVQFKTRRAGVKALVTFLRDRHPYELPEIVVTPIPAGAPDYLGWIVRETTLPEPARSRGVQKAGPA